MKLFLSTCYGISSFLLLLTLTLLSANFVTYILAILSGFILFAQVLLYDDKNNKKNSKLFALNNYYGLSIFLTLLLAINHG